MAGALNPGLTAAHQSRRAKAAAGRASAREWREANAAEFDAMDRAWCFADSRERHPVRQPLN